MFIVKLLIIEIIHGRHIYMKRKGGTSVQSSGESERESVESARIAESWGDVCCKNGRFKHGQFWDKPG